MVDVLLLCREHGPARVELAVRGALAAGAIDGRAVAVLARRAESRTDRAAPPLTGLDARLAAHERAGARAWPTTTQSDRRRPMTRATRQTAALEALIEAHAIELKLPTVRRRFRALAAEAIREQQTPVAYLAALLEAEDAERAERRERRRLIDARFPAIKRLDDFRFADNPNGPAGHDRRARRGRLDRRPRERDLRRRLAAPARPSWPPRSRSAPANKADASASPPSPRLANELQEAESRRELARVVGRYARTELVVFDELGYLALPDGAAELVFQVLSERHERGSLIVTTNLPFGEWTKVFPDARLAKAVVDRAHPPRPHHRHRHRVLALPPRPQTQAPLLNLLTAKGTHHVLSFAGYAGSGSQSGRISTNNNRRQMGPLQAVAPGPAQAVVLSNGAAPVASSSSASAISTSAGGRARCPRAAVVRDVPAGDAGVCAIPRGLSAFGQSTDSEPSEGPSR